jgi:hypothetical protein
MDEGKICVMLMLFLLTLIPAFQSSAHNLILSLTMPFSTVATKTSVLVVLILCFFIYLSSRIENIRSIPTLKPTAGIRSVPNIPIKPS